MCASCASARLKLLRPGVSRLREELEALARQPVVEVTAATEAVTPAAVMIGTEALLYRRPRGVRPGAVVFLDFDQELLAPRYRAGEQALALLARAARAVGGRRHGGVVVVQTRVPDHVVIEAARHGDVARFVESEETMRAALRLPPSTALAEVSGPGAAAFVEQLWAGRRAGDVEILGPTDGRWLIRASEHDALCDALADVELPDETVRVDVDPLRV